jgi:thymidylate synthase (FAD)
MPKAEILQNAGTYKLLTPPELLQQQHLIIERAGRTCYQTYKGEPITQETAARFCRMLIARGHESVLEHSVMTVLMDKHSRGFTHELVRHRLSAFSQESTRYVDSSLERNEAMAVCPPGHDPDAVLYEDENGRDVTFRTIIDDCFYDYEKLREAGWPPEDARQILKIGTKSEIVISANFRQWRHIFHMRCDMFAHWEIRRTMVELLLEVQELLPGIYDDFVFGGVCKKRIPWYIRKLNFKNVMRRQLRLLTDKERTEALEILQEVA